MNSKGLSLTLLSAIVAVLLSTQLPFLIHLIKLPFTSFSPSIISMLTASNIYGHNHHHHHHGRKRRSDSICDNFPPNFPPPDSNTTTNLCVDQNGCCNFTMVQAAVDAVGVASQKRTIIWINSGIYYEKVMIPRTKPNITFQGQGMASTAIVWNDTANSSHGTFYSSSVAIFGNNFAAKNISFMNVAPIPKPGDVGAQAVAIRVGGDQAAFWGCGFFGAQDTLHDDKGRHYFKECFIQGSIDFIFGNARSLYEERICDTFYGTADEGTLLIFKPSHPNYVANQCTVLIHHNYMFSATPGLINCQLISMANPVPAGLKTINGAVTAHGRQSKDENTGFAFVNCTIGGTGRIWLGRAWRPFSRVVFAYTYMSEIISPEGWNDFNDATRDQTIFYGEYNCMGGGANLTMRVPYLQRLTDAQASPFLDVSYIDGDQWLKPLL